MEMGTGKSDLESNVATPSAARRQIIAEGGRLIRSLLWGAFALAIFAVGRNVWIARNHGGSVPVARCDAPLFDFGTAFVGDVVNHSFKIVNVSGNPLRFSRVDAECGCITITQKLNGRVLNPGESCDVPVKVATGKPDTKGKRKAVFVRFVGHDPLSLYVNGIVKPTWDSSQNVVVFDDAPVDEVTTRTIFLVRDAESPPATISQITTSAYLRATFERELSEGLPEKWKVTVHTVPPIPPGRTHGTLMITPSDSAGRAFRIPVTLTAEKKEPTSEIVPDVDSK